MFRVELPEARPGLAYQAGGAALHGQPGPQEDQRGSQVCGRRVRDDIPRPFVIHEYVSFPVKPYDRLT